MKLDFKGSNNIPIELCCLFCLPPTVSLRVDSSTAYLYGTLIRMFMHVKENLFGEDQHFTPMDIVTNSSTDVYKSSLKLDPSNHSSEDFDPRLYRYTKFSNFKEQNYLILENKTMQKCRCFNQILHMIF